MSDFMVLGIDPGKVGGYALLDQGGNVLESGQVKEREALKRRAVLRRLVTECLARGVDAVVCREKWSAGGFAGPSTMAGLGAAWGRWQESMTLNAPMLPDSRIVAVYPQTWRSAVGVGGSDVEKNMRARVRGRWPHLDAASMGEDELMAIGLALYGLRHGAEVIPKHAVPMWHAKANGPHSPSKESER